jgi:UDP-glucose 4-epimerase
VSGRILVVGGAGYIGSHTVKHLGRNGFAPTTLDNLCTGFRDAVVAGDFVHADLLDREALQRVFSRNRYDAVVHFAAHAYVGESVTDPRKYYNNNVVGTLNLLHAMLDAGVKNLVFSSTCATYGEPKVIPISEEAAQHPINPYGQTKLVMEHAMRDYASAYGLNTVSLRYFNAAGADPEGVLRERHNPETHLIPLVLEEAARVLRGGDPQATKLKLFGTDYPTRDGSCIRDYIHVQDLASAHVAALKALLAGTCTGFEPFNLSTEKGVSVLELIEGARKITGAAFRYTEVPRRAGDPPELVGSAAKARRVLGWTPEWSSLETILETAWRSFPR